ncbi:coiled-coil domain-containing protein 115 isoform X2 [Eurytemora carolleeae]|uniref:coiled-coil domain-containing protein 115 isoform X1 n=1 Tax=Eurytemora carolleeae TaxID=1294199 RepID=UPI000C75A509|nr:coiled-coil domain-containing protein 115 isoform X1 [Eurytemora carolleeae]XP_023321467.1 coiled-coil domain-containing protein 115 isoform X2 [Eurytemora carolleeae]|eukprot:XP_023321466.1 coiled-coil domain-containing protein 115-like isoform X1 [Eurytemora affinis]
MSPESAVDQDVSTELSTLGLTDTENYSKALTGIDNATAGIGSAETVTEVDKDTAGIDSELSDLALDLILLSQELVNTKLKLEHLTKSGWMEMAKARYILGPASVSAIQLPSAEQEKPVLASKQIFRSECLRGDGNVRYNYFSLADPSTSGVEVPEGVRLRKCEEKPGSGIEEIVPEKSLCVDPIRWFGFMPPDPLKKSQKWFSMSVESILEISNIQNEMRGVQDRIKYLRRQRGKEIKSLD